MPLGCLEVGSVVEFNQPMTLRVASETTGRPARVLHVSEDLAHLGQQNTRYDLRLLDGQDSREKPSWVLPGLWLSGADEWDTPKGIEGWPRSELVMGFFQKYGFTHVLSVISDRGNPPPPEVILEGRMELRRQDTKDSNLLGDFSAAIGFIHNARAHGGCVLVHCRRGLSRSATLVLAYLMAHIGLTLEGAMLYLRGMRSVSPNEGFIEQLRAFQEYSAEFGRSKLSEPQELKALDHSIVIAKIGRAASGSISARESRSHATHECWATAFLGCSRVGGMAAALFENWWRKVSARRQLWPSTERLALGLFQSGLQARGQEVRFSGDCFPPHVPISALVVASIVLAAKLREPDFLDPTQLVLDQEKFGGDPISCFEIADAELEIIRGDVFVQKFGFPWVGPRAGKTLSVRRHSPTARNAVLSIAAPNSLAQALRRKSVPPPCTWQSSAEVSSWLHQNGEVKENCYGNSPNATNLRAQSFIAKSSVRRKGQGSHRLCSPPHGHRMIEWNKQL